MDCYRWTDNPGRLRSIDGQDCPLDLDLAMLRQAAAMPAASRPRSASSSPRSPCSMKWSGMPRRRTRLVSTPASAAASSTARAEAAHQRRFFDRDDEAALADRAQTIVSASSGLTKRALMTPTSSPSSRKRSRRFEACGQQRAAADDHAVVAPREHFALAELDRRALAGERSQRSPSDSGSRTGRRAAARSRASAAGRARRRGHDDHVREHAQVAEVEHAVVRRPVGAGEAAAVEHERDRQILQRDFLEDLVVRPLQERAVDVDDRPQAGLGLAGGEGHGVGLADAGVEEAVGECVADLFRACCPGTSRR